MDYIQEIQAYFKRLAKKDFRKDLEPMREACTLLNNPQATYASIHIAGTNGKGSTAIFLSTLLQSLGYQVGLMTSPHLIDVRERIQINQTPISWEAMAELVGDIRRLLPDEEYLSYFEMLTLLGFEYFSKMGIDIAVIETGLGGRFDATNVIQPQVAVLTPISLDHEMFLGNSLAKIAHEKCGIFKSEMRVVSAPQKPEVVSIIEKSCKKLGLSLQWADPEKFQFPLGLPGEFQKMNAAAALLAAEALLENKIPPSTCEHAFQKTKWAGRLQYLQENPCVLIDGAHNIASLECLAEYLREKHPDKKIHFLVGSLKDKNWKTMFAPLASLAERFIAVTPQTSRALNPKLLSEILTRYGKPVETYKDPIPKVFKRVLSSMDPKDLLVATGSLYVVGEVLSCFPKRDSDA